MPAAVSEEGFAFGPGAAVVCLYPVAREAAATAHADLASAHADRYLGG